MDTPISIPICQHIYTLSIQEAWQLPVSIDVKRISLSFQMRKALPFPDVPIGLTAYGFPLSNFYFGFDTSMVLCFSSKVNLIFHNFEIFYIDRTLVRPLFYLNTGFSTCYFTLVISVYLQNFSITSVQMLYYLKICILPFYYLIEYFLKK